VTDLLERDGDLAALQRAVVDARDRRGSVVLITGEAGIGKSSLVRAWTAVPGTDARVLVGWCDDFLTSRTLGPLHDIARSTGGDLGDAVARADVNAVLDALLEELDNPIRPTVLVLEDVHWADEATLDVTRYLGRRIAHLPAVLALTYRDDEVDADHPLHSVLGVLPAAVVHRVQPRPLSRAAVADLATGTDLDPAEVVRITGGNPFFVTEVVRSDDPGARAGVPLSVADAVVARLRALPSAAQHAVELLSVMPRAADREEVDALVTDDAAIATAEEHGLLVVTDVGLIGFRHELARRAILTALPVATQLRHHETVLDYLLAADGDSPAILHHAVALGRGDIVVRYGVGAVAEASAASSNREVVAHAEHVLAHADLLDTGTHATVLEALAWARYNLLRFDAAAAAADAAAALRSSGADVAARAKSLLTAARMAYMTNRPDRCFALIDEAADLVEQLPDPEVEAEVRVNHAAMLELADRHMDAIEEAERATALVTAEQRPDIHVLAGVYSSGARVILGDPDGLTALREAIAFGIATGQPEPAARGYTNLVEFLVVARRWDEALTTAEEALAHYDDHDLPAHRYNTMGQQARIQIARGDWAEAKRILGRLAALEEEPGVLATIATGAHAQLAIRSGDPRAEALLQQAWDLAVASGSGWYLAPTACDAMELAWCRGEPEFADPYLEVVRSLAASTLWYGDLLWRAALIGRDVGATGAGVGEPERASLAGDWQAAAAGWRDLGMLYEYAVELLREDTAEPLLEALQVFDRLGAEPAGRIARRRLRDLGVTGIPRGPQTATRENPAGLTDRQVDVLALLAGGLTNAEIADRLVVSVRTVDHHVSAILQKLGVGSRQEAARLAPSLLAPESPAG
jgi:ATP/maltotriose-dependent transcriptional regulator MalT